MKKIKKLLAVFAAVSVALMLPLQTMAAVDLNAKYDISTNQIQGWPAGPDITSDTGILMDADTGVVLYNKGADEQRLDLDAAASVAYLRNVFSGPNSDYTSVLR